jgi:hypothetical protein
MLLYLNELKHVQCLGLIIAGMDGTGLGLSLHHQALAKYVVLYYYFLFFFFVKIFYSILIALV